ncbi:hypothetical protein ACROYT_G027818 [Oculina patagonica]
MKSAFGVIWFALLCSFWMPSVQGVGEYVINEKYDAILVDCAIAFLVLAIIFLILLLITSFFIYRRLDEDRAHNKTYQVSYRDPDHGGEVRDISSPFYGHSIYSRRTTNTIYLPGRESTTVVGTDGMSVKNVAYENEAAVMDVEGKRDSPPTEKGQKDSMVSEKSTTAKISYDNSAYDSAVASGSHTYDSVDDTIRTTRTVRYTTTTVTTSTKEV